MALLSARPSLSTNLEMSLNSAALFFLFFPNTSAEDNLPLLPVIGLKVGTLQKKFS